MSHYVSSHQRHWDTYLDLFIFVYKMRMQRATGLLPFNVIQPREPPSAASFDILTGSASDVQRDVAPRHMPRRLLRRIELMKATVSWRLSGARQHYRNDFDRNVRQEPTFKAGDWLFVDWPPQASIVSDAADEMAIHHYSNIVSCYGECLERTKCSTFICTPERWRKTGYPTTLHAVTCPKTSDWQTYMKRYIKWDCHTKTNSNIALLRMQRMRLKKKLLYRESTWYVT